MGGAALLRRGVVIARMGVGADDEVCRPDIEDGWTTRRGREERWLMRGCARVLPGAKLERSLFLNGFMNEN
jgi:hypothetical protein